jgi:hypothetical protein
MPLRGTCLRRCRFRNVSPLGCYPMDEVPPAVTDERTMMAAALPIRMNAHSRRSICSSQGLCNQQTQ